jgi:uncharacterized protein (TIGR03435 family)
MLMLQALLAERFHLTLHRESKVEAVYKLVPSPGGPKLHAAAGNSAPGCSLAPEGGAACQNTSMFAFSNYLSERMGRPVLDATGLQGSYDFVLKLDGAPGSNALRQAIASSDDPGSVKRSMAASLRDWTSTSIFSDLPKQLGLKLESDKGPIDHLVIDRLEKLAEN